MERISAPSGRSSYSLKRKLPVSLPCSLPCRRLPLAKTNPGKRSHSTDDRSRQPRNRSSIRPPFRTPRHTLDASPRATTTVYSDATGIFPAVCSRLTARLRTACDV